MNYGEIAHAEVYKRIIERNNKQIIKMLSKMEPGYKEQQRQSMNEFVRSLS